MKRADLTKFNWILFLGLPLLASHCVRPKVYHAEVLQRQQSLARESVLQKELTDRKSEAEKMILTIGQLNQTIGKMEVEITDLRARIVNLSANANQTSTTLMEEKQQLQRTLSEKISILQQTTTELNRLRALIQQRGSTLQNHFIDLNNRFQNQPEVRILLQNDHIIVALPDQVLFDPSGVAIAPKGKLLLTTLGQYLSEQPAILAEITAYTDNQIPKGLKKGTDTWEWSLQRAIAITRILATDLGVNANQLTPIGKGEFFPIATNETPEGRLQNRRTEIIIRPELKEVR